MLIINRISEIRNLSNEWKNQGLSVALVPTMGYLHEGHLSLIKKARESNDKVIVSIFLNPTQFSPNEDLNNYPKDLESDSKLCNEAKVDAIFTPNNNEMYKGNFSTYVSVLGLSENLCGKSRPIHFRGVCTVVTKLFNIIYPNRAYFGEKDAQQLAIIKHLVNDLNFNIEIVGCPIVREEDGLAKSSRNIYLSKEERNVALVLNKALKKAKYDMNLGERNSENIIKLIKNVIDNEPLAKIDYVNIVDSYSIQPVSTIESNVLVAIAVYIGRTRLIDNFTFEV